MLSMFLECYFAWYKEHKYNILSQVDTSTQRVWIPVWIQYVSDFFLRLLTMRTISYQRIKGDNISQQILWGYCFQKRVIRHEIRYVNNGPTMQFLNRIPKTPKSKSWQMSNVGNAKIMHRGILLICIHDT